MKRIIWLEMKNYLKGNIAVFLLSVLAFTFTGITINMAMHSYLEARSFRMEYEESYGGRAFYKISHPASSAISIQLFGADNIENIRRVFEELKADPLFEFHYRAENSIQFFDFDDPAFGFDDFPLFRHEFLEGYEAGFTEFSLRDDSLTLKGLYADKLLQNEPNIYLEEGRWFSDDEFFVHDRDDIHMPVILGAGYRDLYEIGDVLINARLGAMSHVTLHVIGFLEEGSWFYDNNNARLRLDRYMVVPSPEATYDPILEDGSICEFYRMAYSSFKISNARIVTEVENAEAVRQRVYQIFHAGNQYELSLHHETSGAQRALYEFRAIDISMLAINIFTLLLCILMFSIQANYKLHKYKKKYGIYQMCGITAKELLLIMMGDMVLLFALANILTLALSKITFYHERFTMLPLVAPTIVVILAMQIILLGFIGFTGHRKVHKTNMSAALREGE